ncbi:hypothetical protein ASPZODRAFT_148131 [Penicilliopsis zonata CBS 506.65]|uniref:Methyltransferase domain-containing protein n=1 Tax=Penicilliopsis zonata CBS 506.65 TaxID=1073090 RepID=A0A1L9STY2_9EURO|nr:hypothetical protein ASPZODRAFT_148131 [Penicilliopsis zonata CBS 506.65]OJJ50675.1 hypothetical protein ASPZODRAFT_148131 [Penicilliopsis zonata CBS 506.65]
MAVYTTDHSEGVLKTHLWRTAENSAAYLLPHIRPAMNILDVGCGPGSITADLAQRVPQGYVTAIDYVSDPLDGARSLAASRGVHNVTFQVGDIHSLEFPDNTFDVVHVHQVLQHIADPVQALREMRRVVKPGGIVAARESAALSWFPDNEGISAWEELSDRMGRARGGNPHPGRYIHSWAEKAGFARDQITRSADSWCFSSDEQRAYWGGSMGQRATSSGYSQVAVGEGFATQETLDLIAQGWKQYREDGQGWFGILHGEILCRK